MTEKIEQMLTYYVKNREHHKFRRAPKDPYRFAVNYEREGLDDLERTVRRLRDMLEEETPVVLPGESIAFLRTVVTVPEIYTAAEFEELSRKHYIHEQGKV